MDAESDIGEAETNIIDWENVGIPRKSFSPKIKLILTFHLFSAMALSNLWTNYTGQAIFCAVWGRLSFQSETAPEISTP